ncbi:MAG: NAD(P)-dependent oxidoreductase [Nanoarchaeota archaeon]|nr:NAD(P)-dependent oxidoreductase [Nanoarchaeota archaeon]
MKIGFFELEKWEQDYIKNNLNGHKIFFYSEKLNIKNAHKIKNLDAVVCFIYSRLTKDVLMKTSGIKLISTMSTGFNHIDTNYCKENGIKVSNVPSYGENTVAEHAFGLILSLSKKLNLAIARTKKDNFSLKGLMGFDLKGKKLGVIGVGKIGYQVIRMAKGFDMDIIAFDLYKNNGWEKELGFTYVSLDKLLMQSDIITLHVPLNGETRHIINMGNIKKIKRGVYIVNTSRGEVIETKALLYGLDKGIISGAGLDVLEEENQMREHKKYLHSSKNNGEIMRQNHKLLKNDNVLITPHSAFYTKEAIKRILDTTIENINSFSKGKTLNSVY